MEAVRPDFSSSTPDPLIIQPPYSAVAEIAAPVEQVKTRCRSTHRASTAMCGDATVSLNPRVLPHRRSRLVSAFCHGSLRCCCPLRVPLRFPCARPADVSHASSRDDGPQRCVQHSANSPDRSNRSCSMECKRGARAWLDSHMLGCAGFIRRAAVRQTPSIQRSSPLSDHRASALAVLLLGAETVSER